MHVYACNTYVQLRSIMHACMYACMFIIIDTYIMNAHVYIYIACIYVYIYYTRVHMIITI